MSSWNKSDRGWARRTSAVALGMLAMHVSAFATSPELSQVRVSTITPEAEHGKILYLKSCARCHGGRAWGDGPRAIPALAGQREYYLIEQLTDFATGRRSGESMHETMRRPDLNWPQAVRDLAAYLAQAEKSPAPEYDEGHDLAAGRRVYAEWCTACHGSDGEGKEGTVPAIGGQQYRYVLLQLENFLAGRRAQHGEMSVLRPASGLSQQQQRDVSNYVSHLGYLTAPRY